MRGATLLELLAVLVIVGVAAAIVVPPLGRVLDQAAVDEAADRYLAIHETTRALAVARSRPARVALDSAARTATLALRRDVTAWDTIETRALGRAAMSVSQPVVTFSALGLGFGVSNTRIVFRAGAAAETLTVSRTGRLKRH